MMAQSLMLAKKPHVVIATPGRLVDHLENTKGFTLKALKCLVRTAVHSQGAEMSGEDGRSLSGR